MKAFPTETASPPGYRRANYDEGMDLRDYFAAAALGNVRHLYRQNDIARAAYTIADAMMKAREENHG
jgi:hypothetical protein